MLSLLCSIGLSHGSVQWEPQHASSAHGRPTTRPTIILLNALHPGKQDYASVQAAGGMPAYRTRREAKQSPVHYKVVAGGKLVWTGTGTHGGAFGEGS